jgi:hypothetical protein
LPTVWNHFWIPLFASTAHQFEIVARITRSKDY